MDITLSTGAIATPTGDGIFVVREGPFVVARDALGATETLNIKLYAGNSTWVDPPESVIQLTNTVVSASFANPGVYGLIKNASASAVNVRVSQPHKPGSTP